MTHRIRRIGVLRAATIGGIASASMSLLIVPFMVILILAARSMAEVPYESGNGLMAPAFLLLTPLIYGVIGFVTSALLALVYNLIALMVGGLEIELDPVA